MLGAPATSRHRPGSCMARRSYHQDKFHEALRDFLKVDILYDAPRWQAAALLEAGKVYERLDQWADAAETYERLLTKFPKEPSAAAAQLRRDTARRRAADNFGLTKRLAGRTASDSLGRTSRMFRCTLQSPDGRPLSCRLSNHRHRHDLHGARGRARARDRSRRTRGPRDRACPGTRAHDALRTLSTMWAQTRRRLESLVSDWYRRTPPAMRVTWGGMIALRRSGPLGPSRAIGAAASPKDHADGVHGPVPGPASRRQARLRPGTRPLRAEPEPGGARGAGGGAALGATGRRPGAGRCAGASGRDRATAAQRRDLAPDRRADAAAWAFSARCSRSDVHSKALSAPAAADSARGDAAPRPRQRRRLGPGLAATLTPLSTGIVIATLSLVAYDGLLIRIEKLAGEPRPLGAETIDAIAMAAPISTDRPDRSHRMARARTHQAGTRPTSAGLARRDRRISRTFAWTRELA